jgi:hypothetical protein
MEKIKPPDCQVCFIHDNEFLPFKNIWAAQYDEYNQIAIIFTKKMGSSTFKKTTYNNKILHQLLHEICHHLTWDKKWGRKECNYSPNGIWNYYKTYYLCEYKAEKMLRQICKQYQWHEVLKASDEWVGAYRKFNPEPMPRGGYRYAARRIHREESK